MVFDLMVIFVEIVREWVGLRGYLFFYLWDVKVNSWYFYVGNKRIYIVIDIFFYK